jgi:hypothetical protein
MDNIDRTPVFDSNGNLPPGEHLMNIEDVKKYFGGSKSLKRSRLTKNLIHFYRFIQYDALTVYLDGSYTSPKLSPGDVDILVELRSAFFDSEDNKTRLLEFQKKDKYFLHIFAFCTIIQKKYFDNIYQTFTHDRDNNIKGLIHLEIKDDQNQKPIK